jgi:hypothetical protein
LAASETCTSGGQPKWWQGQNGKKRGMSETLLMSRKAQTRISKMAFNKPRQL